MPAVTFQPLGARIECADGESIFEVAQRGRIPIATACMAKGTCGLCRVKVLAGDAHLSAPGAIDRKHIGNVYFITKVRLSCQARVSGGEVEVELPGYKKP